MCSDNASGAVNQQERLDAYIAGYVDGEGSFHVAVQRNPWTRAGWQLVPEFHVSQSPERRQVLDLIERRLGLWTDQGEPSRLVRHHAGVGRPQPERSAAQGHPLPRDATSSEE